MIKISIIITKKTFIKIKLIIHIKSLNKMKKEIQNKTVNKQFRIKIYYNKICPLKTILLFLLRNKAKI